MARNTLKDLRDHLFETIEALKDATDPMDIERATAIAGVAQTIINSAKVEVDLVKAVSSSSPGSRNFFGLPEEGRSLPAARTPGGVDRG